MSALPPCPPGQVMFSEWCSEKICISVGGEWVQREIRQDLKNVAFSALTWYYAGKNLSVRTGFPPSSAPLTVYFKLAELLTISKFRFLHMELVLITSQWCSESFEITSETSEFTNVDIPSSSFPFLIQCMSKPLCQGLHRPVDSLHTIGIRATYPSLQRWVLRTHHL